MRIPRLNIRRLMLLTSVLTLGCFIASQSWDGLPPRFVVRGIPARIARLEPGMTWQQAHDILSLETSWLRGGTDAKPFVMEGMAMKQFTLRRAMILGVP